MVKVLWTVSKPVHVSGLVKKKNVNGKVWAFSETIQYYHCDQTLKNSYQTLSAGDFVEQSVQQESKTPDRYKRRNNMCEQLLFEV